MIRHCPTLRATKRVIFGSAVAAALSLAAPAPFGIHLARATVMWPLTLSEMAQSADAVAQGIVVRTGVQLVWDGDGEPQPRTRTWIRVTRWLGPGPAPTTPLEIADDGGAFPGGAWILGASPSYQTGEEVLVFLGAPLGESPAGPPSWRTLNLAYGKFRVLRPATGEPIARRDLHDVAFLPVDMSALPHARPDLTDVPLARALDEIQAARPRTAAPAGSQPQQLVPGTPRELTKGSAR